MKRYGKGWFRDSHRHYLAAKGIKTKLTVKEIASRSVYDIEKLTKENKDYRRVISTNPKLQVVLMSIPKNGDVGMEVHPHTDQFFRIESGKGDVIMNGKIQKISNGYAFTVPEGTHHDVINTGSDDLKFYTVYAPPNHKNGIVRKTKHDAEMIPEYLAAKFRIHENVHYREMTPEEYLKLTGTSPESPDLNQYYDVETMQSEPIAKLAKHMEEGDVEITPPYFRVREGEFNMHHDFEGRHRAKAAIIAGEKKIPVKIARPPEQTSNAIAEEYAARVRAIGNYRGEMIRRVKKSDIDTLMAPEYRKLYVDLLKEKGVSDEDLRRRSTYG